MTVPLVHELQNNPFDRLRVGRIIKLYLTQEDLVNKSRALSNSYLGTADVEYLDWGGVAQSPVKVTFPSFSNPILNPKDQLDVVGGSVTTSCGYGFIGVPSIGDVVIVGYRDSSQGVILAYLPHSFDKQFSEVSSNWGRFKQLVSGEYLWKSKQQFEVYLDRAGAGHFTFYKQGTGSGKPPINIATDASKNTVLGKLDLGITYDSTFSTKNVSTATGNPVAVKLDLPDSGLLQIDTEGNWEIECDKSLTITKGTATITIDSNGKITVKSSSGQKVTLGPTTTVQPVPLGTDLVTAVNSVVTTLNALVTAYNSHLHGGVSAGGSSTTGPSATGSPATPLTSAVLSSTVEVSQ